MDNQTEVIQPAFLSPGTLEGKKIGEGGESIVLKTANDLVIKLERPINPTHAWGPFLHSREFLKRTKQGYHQMEAIFGDYLLKTLFVRGSAVGGGETNVRIQRGIEGHDLEKLAVGGWEKAIAADNSELHRQAMGILVGAVRVLNEMGVPMDLHGGNIIYDSTSQKLRIIDAGPPLAIRDVLTNDDEQSNELKPGAKGYIKGTIDRLKWYLGYVPVDPQKRRLMSEETRNEVLKGAGISDDELKAILNDPVEHAKLRGKEDQLE